MGILPTALMRLVQKHTVAHTHAGIALCDSTFRGRSDEFVERAVAALTLIERRDPARYWLILRHIRCIDNSPFPTGYMVDYDHATRSCSLNFSCLDFPEGVDGDMMFACCIVHAAVTGRIASYGIPKTRDNAPRIESVCRLEERRFLSRVGAATLEPATGEPLLRVSMADRITSAIELLSSAFREAA